MHTTLLIERFSFVGYIAILMLAFDEARKGPSYGAFYQKTVFGYDSNKEQVVIAKLKFPTFTLKMSDGQLRVVQGKVK